MSHQFYSTLHLGSLFALSLVLGGLWGLYLHPAPDKHVRRFLLACHGLIMFLIFVAGFGLMAKLKIPFPWPHWIYGKLLIWLSLGVAPVLIKKISQKKNRPKKIYILVFMVLFAILFSALLIVKLK